MVELTQYGVFPRLWWCGQGYVWCLSGYVGTSETISLSITHKSSAVLGFLRRNLKYCPQKCKRTGYLHLTRSLEDGVANSLEDGVFFLGTPTPKVTLISYQLALFWQRPETIHNGFEVTAP